MAKLLQLGSSTIFYPMDAGFAIAVHGGAGTLARQQMTPALYHEYESSLMDALKIGVQILQNGGRSLDAVEASVNALEDNPLFNAGRGSVFNHQGGHELDAAIMDGANLAAGAVAGISRVKNPIRLARAVLEQGEYVLLCGDKAVELAESLNFALRSPDYFFTDSRHRDWKTIQNNASAEIKKFGTVGAVARDQAGHLAAATSTGGLVNKRYGRVGDSCIIGGGTYANDATCAVSCTGEGEQFIRAVAAYDISARLAYQGIALADACDQVLARIVELGGSGGLIAIDSAGTIAMPFRSEGMYRACCHLNGEIEVGIF
jgi:beta-aspartyl-peptidase (threonine type)